MPFKNLLEVVQSCDKFPYDESVSTSEYHSTIPFRLGPHVIGRLLPSTVPKLKEYNDRFDSSPFEIKESHITFSMGVDSFEKRTEVVKALFDMWREEKAFVALAGKQAIHFIRVPVRMAIQICTLGPNRLEKRIISCLRRSFPPRQCRVRHGKSSYSDLWHIQLRLPSQCLHQGRRRHYQNVDCPPI
jgi:Domain of unknown function (DUF4743)